MLKKRIIPCLDIQNGRTVKGVNFKSIRDAGEPIELAKRYVAEGADELVFLDITATIENRKTLLDLVGKVALEINIPFTVGGGINTLEDVENLVNAGADKISINSAAIRDPDLIRRISAEYGSQCVVVAIDTKRTVSGDWMVYINGGRISTGIHTLDWAMEVQRLGAGEVLLTSMNGDGTKSGYSTDITAIVASNLQIPVIASGGAGERVHFKSLFEDTEASAALAASIFHFGEISIPELKHYLHQINIPVRLTN